MDPHKNRICRLHQGEKPYLQVWRCYGHFVSYSIWNRKTFSCYIGLIRNFWFVWLKNLKFKFMHWYISPKAHIKFFFVIRKCLYLNVSKCAVFQIKPNFSCHKQLLFTLWNREVRSLVLMLDVTSKVHTIRVIDMTYSSPSYIASVYW